LIRENNSCRVSAPRVKLIVRLSKYPKQYENQTAQNASLRATTVDFDIIGSNTKSVQER
jgi:hypothetical protein